MDASSEKIAGCQQPDNFYFDGGAFPFIYRQQASQDMPGLSHTQTFIFNETDYLQTLAGKSAHEVFYYVLSAFGVLFSRYSSSIGVSFDAPVFFGGNSDNYTGGFIKLMVPVKPAVTVKEYLAHVGEKAIIHYPGSSVDSDSRNNILIMCKNLHGDITKASQYDLIIDVKLGQENIHIDLTYNRQYFQESFIKGMQRHLRQVMAAFKDVDCCLSGIDILSEEDYSLLLAFNDTAVDYPPTTVIELFETAVKQFPHAMALVAGDRAITYGELNEAVNRLAWHLITDHGIKKGDTIGIIANCSVEWIIGILASGKSGGCYLPLDPASPADRLAFQLTEAAAKIVLTTFDQIPYIDYFAGPLFALDLQLYDLKGSTANPPIVNDADDIAYVIFTSGSSGTPKGVMISHSSLVNLCNWHIRAFSVNGQSKATLYANVSFDASVWEMWPYLLCGAALFPLTETVKMNPPDLATFFYENRITHCFLPTPIYAEINRQGIALRENMHILIGGDELKDKVVYPHRVLVNNYGPTEATVVATSIYIDSHTPPACIGKPIDNTRIFIMDENLRIVPIGAAGEIYIGGNGLAKGYCNNHKLTTEKFIVNPHTPNSSDMLYRSGDIGCWTHDGNILFKGRADNQVKIRGNRVELGEIEYSIKQFDHIIDVHVLAADSGNGDKELRGYLIVGAGAKISELPNFLKNRIPGYMVPSRFFLMDKFPLTANGKIDNKGLAALTGNGELMPPLPALDTPLNQIINIWESVLECSGIITDSNFFAFGGDSIKAIRLIYEVNKAFNSGLKLMDIFNHDTPQSLLAKINEIENLDNDKKLEEEINLHVKDIMSKYKGLHGSSDIEDVYPIADIQLGMLYHGLYDEAEAMYHDQIIHQVKYPRFEPRLLKKALTLMAGRHEILRTGFDLQNAGVPVQIVYRSVQVDYEHVDISGNNKTEQQNIISHIVETDRKHPFMPAKPGLWRLKTFDAGNDIIVIVFVCHHAIIDGWSDATFSTELNNTYQKLLDNEAFEPLKLQCRYRDYVVSEIVTKRKPEAITFWKKELLEFQKTQFVFELNDNNSVYKSYNINLGADLKEELTQFTSRYKVNQRSVCFSVYLQIIKSLALTDEVLVGLHTHNRPLQVDSDQMLGCFLNTVPVRFEPSKTGTWISYIKAVNQKLVAIGEFNNLSLLEIARLHSNRAKNNEQNLFFDSLFAFLDFHVYKELESKGEEFSSVFALNEVEVSGQGINNTYFNFLINSTLDAFNLLLIYKSSQIDTELAAYIATSFKNMLRRVVSGPDEEIAQRESDKSDQPIDVQIPYINFNL